MKRKVTILLLCACSLGLLQRNCFADYVEGLDTTDVNGYGLDSAFRVDSAGRITGQKIVYYGYNYYGNWGIYNYSFNDINLGMDSTIPNYVRNSTKIPSYCFVTKRHKDSTYSKAQILKKLIDGRYEFQYGSNTALNNRTFVKSDYDRSIRYKPNNLTYGISSLESFSWEAPLPNNNHLLGYTLYISKWDMVDTSGPINPVQWWALGTDSTKYKCSSAGYINGGYFNIVANYTEGRSEFLQGWTRLTVILNTKSPQKKIYLPNSFFIQERSDGYLFNINKSIADAELNVYNMNGQQIAHFPNIKSNSFFWNTSNPNLAEGLYILRAELPDKTVLNQKFMFSR